MSTVFVTFLIAFVFLMLGMIGLGIGWLLKGRPLERGCGKKPGERRREPCDGDTSSCEICNPLGVEKNKEKD